MFCSGANIYMLGLSSHGWKVNFCKFTNETRNGIEDSSRHRRAQVPRRGERHLRRRRLRARARLRRDPDDRRPLLHRVSLPEVPLLGVLPGTGGLTRVTDKRKVRRDLADVFCTTSEGVRADRAKQWKLVDHIAKPQAFAQAVKERVAASPRRATAPAAARASRSPRSSAPSTTPATTTSTSMSAIDRKARAPPRSPFPRRRPRSPTTIEGILAAGAAGGRLRWRANSTTPS